MNQIAALGDELLCVQSTLGLETSKHLQPGLREDKIKVCPLFSNLPLASELHDLFRWRNGSVNSVAMGKLWLTPGFYFISAEESVMSNRYCSESLSDWQHSWFPLLSNGAAGMWFVDVNKVIGGELPVFYSEPEAVPTTGQIYDSIKTMFETFLECYKQKVYYTETAASRLRTNFRREVEIAKKLNPKSDFWLRDDLF